MDGQRFDDLTRAFAATVTRRRALRTLGGAAAGGVLAAIGWRRSGAASCREARRLCNANVDCCSNRCDTTNPDAMKRNRCICSAGTEECRGACKNPATDYRNDALNCGGCARRCAAVLHGTAICEAGRCDFVCNAGYQRCAGGCVPEDSCCIGGTFTATGAVNPVNPCQACRPLVSSTTWSNDDALSCPLPHAIGACQAGVCAAVAACHDGFGNCNGAVVDGCERTLTTTTDCGDCSHACKSGEQCDGGQCRCGTGSACHARENCQAGVCLCGGQPACPELFPNTTVTCDPILNSPLRCVAECAPGYADCDDDFESNGCESVAVGCSGCDTAPCEPPTLCCIGACNDRCSGVVHKCCPQLFDPACPEIIGEEPPECPEDRRGRFTRRF